MKLASKKRLSGGKTVKVAGAVAATATSTPSPPDRDYMALVERFPLRPLRGVADYDLAEAMLDGLILRDLTPGQQDYLDALTLIVEAYDNAHYPIPADKRPPHERLPVADR